MSAEISKPAPKPQCGRCFRPVDSATSSPIVRGGKHVGFRLTYLCHGEKQEYDVVKQWFEEPGHETKPYMDKVFEPEVAMEYSTEDALVDAYKSQMRQKAVDVELFRCNKILEIVQQHPEFPKDVTDQAAVNDWMAQHDVSLMCDLVTHPQSDRVERLYMGVQYLGKFVIPFWPDELKIDWIPAP